MKQITMYKATDGSLYDTAEACRFAEERIKIRAWYENNQVLGNCAGSRVEFDELVEWIIINDEKVKRIMTFFGI